MLGNVGSDTMAFWDCVSVHITTSVPMRQKQCLIYGVVVLIVIYLLQTVRFHLFDECHGKAYLHVICDRWRKGIVSGTMCYSLCVEKLLPVTLSYCTNEHKDHHTFEKGNLIIKVNKGNLEEDNALYRLPEKETTTSEFGEMIKTLIESRLGFDDHPTMVQYFLDMADVNDDAKITLAEAKTLWSLLQHQDFFILSLFQEFGHLPLINGFCGDLYAVEKVPNSYLFYKTQSRVLDFFAPDRHIWGFPVWEKRGKIAMGLLEFAMETYHHELLGTFYMCQTNETSIGYTAKSDMKILDVSNIVPQYTLEKYFTSLACDADRDCRYGQHCLSLCDPETQHCSGQLEHPNLRIICNILRKYLLVKIPQDIKADFLVLLDKCFALKASNEDFDVQHNLILHDLKSLIWKHINVDVS